MKSFEVEGVVYRSISEFCRKRKVSYWKMIRLCRKYVRANKDPAVAARWILGLEQIEFNDIKTMFYFKDIELAKLRNIENNTKKKIKLRKELMKYM